MYDGGCKSIVRVSSVRRASPAEAARSGWRGCGARAFGSRSRGQPVQHAGLPGCLRGAYARELGTLHPVHRRDSQEPRAAPPLRKRRNCCARSPPAHGLLQTFLPPSAPSIVSKSHKPPFNNDTTVIKPTLPCLIPVLARLDSPAHRTPRPAWHPRSIEEVPVIASHRAGLDWRAVRTGNGHPQTTTRPRAAPSWAAGR